MKVVRRYE